MFIVHSASPPPVCAQDTVETLKLELRHDALCNKPLYLPGETHSIGDEEQLALPAGELDPFHFPSLIYTQQFVRATSI